MEKDNGFKMLLRKSGYKATSSRIAILALFKKHKNPMSAQEIVDALPVDIDQATVYRTIRSFEKKGILRQIDLRHNHAHYELVDSIDHHHIICLQCGRIEDVEHQSVATMEKAILQNAKHFSEIRQHTLEFYGICKACAKKRNPEIDG
jgi:Fur family ferric uptake transcriptional regulator